MVRKDKLDDGKIEALIRLLRAAAAAYPDLAKEIGAEINYFETNKERMRYPEFREQGVFVGSGVIEAGCNAECIVTQCILPTCHSSRDFEAFLLRIKVACLSKAISLSVALKSDRRCLCHVVWLQTCLVRMITARLKMKGIHSLWRRTKPGRTRPRTLLHIETIDICVVFSWVALLFLAATDENLPSALDRNIRAQKNVRIMRSSSVHKISRSPNQEPRYAVAGFPNSA